MVGVIVGACLLAGLILLDRWQVGEFGLSQPIVACPLIGIVYGEAAAGLYLGLTLQLVWVASLPLGREQALDYQGAGVVAVLSYLLFMRLQGTNADAGARALFGALGMAGLGTFVGAWLDGANKTLNNRLFRAGERARDARHLVAAHVSGIGTGMLRGSVLAALFLVLSLAAAPLVRMLPVFTKAELLALPLGIGVAAAVRMFVNLRRLPWALAGGLIAGIVWVATRI